MNRKQCKTDWLECQCTVPEHAIQVLLDRGDDVMPPELYIRPVLANKTSLWWRIKGIFAYLFKGEPLSYTESILDDESVDKLSSMIVAYRLLKKLREAKKK